MPQCLRLVFCCTVLTTAVLAQTRPVVTLTFDDSFDGQGAQGVVHGTVVGQPQLVPGRHGRALLAGPTHGSVDYPTAGVLNRQAGTVEMWVSAVDWEPADGKFHVFFETRGQGALYLYKYFTGTNLLMLTCSALEGPYASSQIPVTWKSGEWHHIAGTWSPAGVMAYIDGRPASPLPVEGGLPAALGEAFHIGDQPWQFPRTSSSLIDDVRLYDKALTPSHIAAHAAGDDKFTVPLAAATAGLDSRIDCRAQTVEARFDTGGADVDDAQLAVRFALVPAGAAPPTAAPTTPVSAGRAAVDLPLGGVTPGQRELVATVMRAGQPAFELRRPVIIPATPWLGNQIGLEDKVLPPWTPLTTSGTDVSCWGRTYRFDHAALPTQISSAGAELLARPVTLRVGPDAAAAQAVRLDDSSPTRAHLTGSAQLGQTTFRTQVVTEYDGLVTIDVTCDDPTRLPAAPLTLDIPVRTERALYRHRYHAEWMPLSGFVPPGQGVVDQTAFVPFVWLGDNDRGLFWCCESDEMWPNGRAKSAIELVRGDDAVTIRLNLLAADQKLPANWKLTFALQATPVKARPKDWRKWRMSGDGKVPKANVQIVWPNAGKQDSLRAFGYPEAADPAKFQTAIDQLHQAGLKAVPYLCLTWVTDDTPEWQYFRRDWDLGQIDPSIPAAGWHHGFRLVSPLAQSYSDQIIAKTKEFLDRYGIDGVYHDQTHPYASAAPDLGTGYRRDGKLVPTHPIFGYRALYRRDYAMVKSLGRETFTQAHMSGKVVPPVLAYDDSYLDGEHFREVVKDSYLDVMTLDSFRCEYMGRQWGMMPFFLPEFDAEHARQIEPTRGMMALLMLHDVSVWPIWCNTKECNRAFEALDAFGYVDADFVPYFDPHPPATTTLKDVLISAYRLANGQTLLIVGNLGKEDRTGDIQVDLAGLGLTGAKAMDWPGKEPLAMAAGKIQVAVPRLGWKMIVVTK